MLDIEVITGVAGNISSEFWGFSGRSPDNPSNEPFLKWLAQLSSTPDASVPKVFSSSYGEDEASWSRRGLFPPPSLPPSLPSPLLSLALGAGCKMRASRPDAGPLAR